MKTPIDVYDNNVIEDGSYGDYYDQMISRAAWMYRGYSMSKTMTGIYADTSADGGKPL